MSHSDQWRREEQGDIAIPCRRFPSRGCWRNRSIWCGAGFGPDDGGLDFIGDFDFNDQLLIGGLDHEIRLIGLAAGVFDLELFGAGFHPAEDGGFVVAVDEDGEFAFLAGLEALIGVAAFAEAAEKAGHGSAFRSPVLAWIIGAVEGWLIRIDRLRGNRVTHVKLPENMIS